MSILAIVAHPDDEVLGCGATLARAANAGRDVYVAILGEGITSRSNTRGTTDPALLEALNEASHRAAELLGIRELFTYGLPDNRFDTLPLLDVVKTVEELVERLAPRLVITHHPGDVNIDHVVTHRAVVTATRPVARSPVEAVLAVEIPSSTDWAFGGFAPAFRPNTFVDVSTTLDRKIAAMELYESEARPFPHPRSPKALRALAAARGSAAGLSAAEAFELIRAVRRDLAEGAGFP